VDDQDLTQQTVHDGHWMQRCDELAEQALSRSEAGVGAVIVRDNVLMAEASEWVIGSRDIAGHAELIAIRLACAAIGSIDLSGCTLYTNIEPCWMCSYAIRESRIACIVISQPIAEIGGASSHYPILTDSDVSGWPSPPVIRWFRAEE